MKFRSIVAGLLCLSLGSLALATEGDGALPQNPKPGECFVHKFFPPTFAYEEISLTIKDGYKTFTITPPVFQDVSVNVPTADSFENFAITPPTFETKEVKIKISPDDSVWHVNCCDNKHRKPGEPCEQACYKPLRPEYKVFTISKLVKDSQVFITVTPAKFTTIIFKKIITPPKVNVVEVPPVVIKVTIKKLVSPGHMEWIPGTCGHYTCDPKKLQAALKDKGFYNGKIDGNVTEATITAMNKFREANGLGIHNEMDKETAAALGIDA